MWPVGQAVKTAASHAANGSSILPRVTTSEWTTFHSKSPAIWLGFSHTISSFLLNPTKLCKTNFCGGPAAEEADGSPGMRENIIADKARSLTGLFCLKRPPYFSTVMGAFCWKARNRSLSVRTEFSTRLECSCGKELPERTASVQNFQVRAV